MAKECRECGLRIRKIHGKKMTFAGVKNNFSSKIYTCPYCKAPYTSKQYNRLKEAEYEGA